MSLARFVDESGVPFGTAGGPDLFIFGARYSSAQQGASSGAQQDRRINRRQRAAPGDDDERRKPRSAKER